MSVELASVRGARPGTGPAKWLIVTASAGLYLLLGLAFGTLGLPPSHTSALFPAAGLALAVVLMFGAPGLVGVAIGAIALNLLLGGGADPLLATALTAAAVLQAAWGAQLVRRHVQQPLVLTEPRDIARFFLLGALLASVLGASAWTLALVAIEGLDGSQALLHWLTKWAGDALGTILLAPIALTLIGQPRAEWAPRRGVIGASLAALSLLLAVGTLQVAHLDRDRLQADFDREVVNATAALNYKLQQPLHALEAVRGVFVSSGEVTRSDMERATQRWLESSGHLRALGWSERVQRRDIAGFEARVRVQGQTDYRVHERAGSDQAAADGELIVIRYIEPMQGNEGALGVNALSIPQAREAILRSLRDNQPAATAGFRLTQDPGTAPETGIVIYHAVFDESTQARQPRPRGVVFVTLRADKLLQAALADLPAHIEACIVDHGAQLPTAADQPAPQRLAGREGCERTRAPLQRDQQLSFVDRAWTLQFSSAASIGSSLSSSKTWVLATVGMPAAALLAAMLLSMTGRTQRIESAVAERTAALSQEVREREQAEAGMRESEQRFRNIFNNVPIGVVYTDLDGQLQHVNPHFSTLTGYSPDELRRMDVYDYLHPDDAELERDLTRQLLRGEIPMHRGHRRVVRKDGETVWVQATLTLLRDAEGRPRRLVGVMEDITEHLRLVEAERAREQAESANEAKNEFLSRMSHELRTPLNAMLGFAQLLELDQRHPLAAGQRTWVAQIQQAGWHLLDMINDVLDLSRIESGNVSLQMANLDLEALVESCLPLIERDAARRGIRVQARCQTGSMAALGDIKRVKQILINLLSNAVKYNTDGGEILVDTLRDGDFLVLRVTDTGQGMTAEQLAELFQPFNRLGRERSGIEGTGIGLVISRRLAELMGGNLQARSEAGIGSTFLLALPIADEADTVRSDLDPSFAPLTDETARIVHYVEDNETNIEVMRGILSQRPSIEMQYSMTGREAMQQLRREPPDVILLDMNLPDIDGIELLRLLKADPLTVGIPVVVVSADALGPQIDAALDAGALRYLTKPVSVQEVLRVLDEVFEASVPHVL